MMAETSTDKKTALTIHKKLIFVTLAAAALTLSACGKKDEPVVEVVPVADGQTQVAQEATGVAPADDVAVASANDGMTTADGVNDDVAVATADDSK